MTRPLRIVVDVNVLVRIAKAKHERRTGTAAQRIFAALEAGRACGRSVQMVASHGMIDSLYDVLLRLSVPAGEAREFGLLVIAVVKSGPEKLDPHLILGGSPDLNLRDAEDGGVLATAFVARAHMLVTDNLGDFMPRGCETFDTARIRFSDRSERTLACHILARPDGHEIVVAHPIDFAKWIGESFDPTPTNVRARLARR